MGSHVTWVMGMVYPPTPHAPFPGALGPPISLVVSLVWDQCLWHSLCSWWGQLRLHSPHDLCVGFGALIGDVMPPDSTWEPGSSVWPWAGGQNFLSLAESSVVGGCWFNSSCLRLWGSRPPSSCLGVETQPKPPDLVLVPTHPRQAWLLLLELVLSLHLWHLTVFLFFLGAHMCVCSV